MAYLDLSDVNSHVKGRMEPFFNEILSSFDACINSIYIIGSAVTSDFDEKKNRRRFTYCTTRDGP